MPSAATISRLKLKQTYLSDITLEVGNEWLSFLTITDSRMKSVPATMAHLVALEMLEISKSSIETVNLNLFSKLTHLRHLNLCDNKILFLHLSDAAEGNFAQLRDLFLSGNLLTTIDLSGFNNMKLLQTLDLHRNRIRRMQGALVSNSLKFLDLSDNRIETLNCCEWNITSLNRFMLSSNELVTLPSCLPLTMPNVMYLIFQRNALTDFDSWYSLFTLERLYHLDISYNRLTKAVFDNVSLSLSILGLQNNNIKVLSVPAADYGLNILASFNSIDTFDIKSLSPNVTSLEMLGNPIDCTFDRAPVV
ncbi:carboxypeptidase N subunit 2-like [Anopheles arabiensis]|uniref:carboxypeptidase N subunit 2-like n=1 Tax=Anopheles arabiensis TaxID=7173 RepID=UPI001AACCD93|nr:carboxypeptidase N subunit 2-like [Anopheles arabiensis]